MSIKKIAGTVQKMESFLHKLNTFSYYEIDYRNNIDDEIEKRNKKPNELMAIAQELENDLIAIQNLNYSELMCVDVDDPRIVDATSSIIIMSMEVGSLTCPSLYLSSEKEQMEDVKRPIEKEFIGFKKDISGMMNEKMIETLAMQA